MSRFLTICCNLLWFLSSLPGYIRFVVALRKPRRCQTAILRSLMRRNRDTQYGIAHNLGNIRTWNDFQSLPLTTSEEYDRHIARIREGEKRVLTADNVRLLQPTSGTSSGSKLIPYTDGMTSQLRAALDPWIVDLFLRHPRLFGGYQFWIISPAAGTASTSEGAVPIGFMDDAEYFGRWRRYLVDRAMAVPSELRQLTDPSANQYVTCLFLLRTKALRLISVWHPSCLTILLDTIKNSWCRCLHDIHAGGIDAQYEIPDDLRNQLTKKLPPAPKRYRELEALNPEEPDFYQEIWPGLELISCWADGNTQWDIKTITECFPQTVVQPKGLLATEGVVSIPFGPEHEHVCGVNSHVLEFQDSESRVHGSWELEEGEEYAVILTTGAGHYRYQLGDRVRVTGFYKRTPCIRFLRREGVISDYVGEKVQLGHVETIMATLREEFSLQDRLTVVIPSNDGEKPHYKLLLEQSGERPLRLDLQGVAHALESRLCTNYHYRHARNIGQLKHPVVVLVPQGAKRRYRDWMVERGALAGTVKFPALCTSPELMQKLL